MNDAIYKDLMDGLAIQGSDLNTDKAIVEIIDRNAEDPRLFIIRVAIADHGIEELRLFTRDQLRHVYRALYEYFNPESLEQV